MHAPCSEALSKLGDPGEEVCLVRRVVSDGGFQAVNGLVVEAAVVARGALLQEAVQVVGHVAQGEGSHEQSRNLVTAICMHYAFT